MHTPDEKVTNLHEWQELKKKLVDNLSEQDKELYREFGRNLVELGLTEDGYNIDYFEKWLQIKSLEVFVIYHYYSYLMCFDNSYKLKIMELYLKFLMLSNHRDFRIENYLEKILW